MAADLADAPAGLLAAPSPVSALLPSRRQVLHSPWTPRGVYPVNSPTAGRQQGSMGSGGCAGAPTFPESDVGGRRAVSFKPLRRDELQTQHEQQKLNYGELQAKGLSLDLTRGKPSPAQPDLSNEL